MQKTVKLLFVIMFMFSAEVYAEAISYSDGRHGKLIFQAAPELGKNIVLVQFEGTASSDWNKQVFKLSEKEVKEQNRYYFEYEVGASDKKSKKEYCLLIQSGQRYSKRKSYHILQLYLPESKNPITFTEDVENKAKTIDLIPEYTKTKFMPEI
jgi:hypothetical protein